MAEIATGMAEKSSWDQTNRQQKHGLVWKNRKKICQIIKDYFYLPFFLLIILWYEYCKSSELRTWFRKNLILYVLTVTVGRWLRSIPVGWVWLPIGWTSHRWQACCRRRRPHGAASAGDSNQSRPQSCGHRHPACSWSAPRQSSPPAPPWFPVSLPVQIV